MLSHQEIIELFEDDWTADRDNRLDAIDDLRFLAGDQWDEFAAAERQAAGRPQITINRMGQFVRQVTGDMRLNPTGINVLPVDDEGDMDKAEVIEGIIREIEYASSAHLAYAHAFECQAGIGIGHFRVGTQYAPDSVTEQDIRVKRIMNPLSVVWDAGSVELDRSDAEHCFVTELMPLRKFKQKYKDEPSTDFPAETITSDLYWRQGDFVRVCEFWHKQPYKRTLALLADGSTLDITELTESQRKFLNILETRIVDDHKVIQQMVSGTAILKDKSDWAGRHIPIIPAIGAEIPMDERVIRHGLVRWAKDPQRMYNYTRSSQAELIGQQARAPYLITPKMVEGHEAAWNTSNVRPKPYLVYNPDPEAPQGRPTREAPPVASQALWQEGQIATDDMKATTGIYDASLGAQSNEISGRAIMARQREGDVGSFHYFDNFKNGSLRRCGEVIIDLIPKIYDTERAVRIVGKEDAGTSYETVNAEDPHTGEVENDLSVGRYDVRVDTGPSFTTKREEARESMMQATQANPQLWAIAGDLIIKAFDWPHAEEIAERIKKSIPSEIVQDKDAPPPEPDPMQQQQMQMQMEHAAAELAETQAKAGKTAAEAEKAAAEIDKIDAEVEGQLIENRLMVANPPSKDSDSSHRQ